MQGAGAALLGAMNARRAEAEQAEDVHHADRGADGGEVDGRIGDTGLTLTAPLRPLLLGLANDFAVLAGCDELAIAGREDLLVPGGEASARPAAPRF